MSALLDALEYDDLIVDVSVSLSKIEAVLRWIDVGTLRATEDQLADLDTVRMWLEKSERQLKALKESECSSKESP